jgi:hypothetical protein
MSVGARKLHWPYATVPAGLREDVIFGCTTVYRSEVLNSSRRCFSSVTMYSWYCHIVFIQVYQTESGGDF